MRPVAGAHARSRATAPARPSTARAERATPAATAPRLQRVELPSARRRRHAPDPATLKPSSSRKTAPPRSLSASELVGRQGVGDVADQRRAGRPRLADARRRSARPDRRRRVRRSASSARGPRRHRVARRHAAAHPRQLEVRVRVDEPGQDDGRARDPRPRSPCRRGARECAGPLPHATMRPRSAAPSRRESAAPRSAAPRRRGGRINAPVEARLLLGGAARGVAADLRRPADVSPSARATASSSMRGTSRSRKIGSPRIS